MKSSHTMPFGACLTPGGGALFRLWAPSAKQVDLVLTSGPGKGIQLMQAKEGGWYELAIDQADAQTRYAYRIDGQQLVPDPASRCNPDDVHGASLITDPQAFNWPDGEWRGRPWHEAAIYEMHVGCFTTEGSFTSAIAQLDDLVALGITAIELMPVAGFSGQRGWGYDGVLLFAPESGYGTPDELKRLVAEAHARGLMVLLDVVYNHFGPDGNYLHVYAKPFFNAAQPTPWGDAINFDGAHSRTVRDFFIHNALYWIEEFHFDGLRIDAVHAMHDSSQPHFIDELTEAVRQGPGQQRAVHIVLENDRNDAKRLARNTDGSVRLANAQWNDDVHHALHVLATGERDGYYIDFATEPQRLLGRALTQGYGYQGEASAYRSGEAHGTPSAHLPPLAFVNALQTHDQVGNRAFGERIAMLTTEVGRDNVLRALAACLLLSPSVPMLFMGQEYAASTPFLYFCNYAGTLAQAVTRGRRAEFERFARFSDPARRALIPDPNAEDTFLKSKLDWAERKRAPHAAWLAFYTDLLRRRNDKLVPWLEGAGSGEFDLQAPGTLRMCWPLGGGRRWHLLAQLDDRQASGPQAAPPPGDTVYRSHPAASRLSPWSVHVTVETE
jgi:maltooligosyltrehalose trehalohydrolase